MCSAFLWSGSPTITHKAKFAWKDLCCPKEEGGLGIRRLSDTSRVFALSLIWKLFSLTGSFWVAWTRQYLLKNSSYWDASDKKGSWVWRKLLKHRPIAYECIRFEVRNGVTVHFWFDNWLEIGRLIDITGELGISYLGVSRSTTLAEATRDDCWNIRRCGQRRYPHLCDTLAETPRPVASAGPDIALWRHDQDDFKPYFSATKTWNYLRVKKTKLPCMDECCREITWSSDNTGLGRYSHLHVTPEQEQTRCYTPALSFSDSHLCAVKERNSRRHGSVYAPVDTTTKAIENMVKKRISSLKYMGNHKLRGLLVRWFTVYTY
ncbi:uncharacterized protein LOC106422538 [Brassica napus]|nr:uncharacterized protein LOC106422538 [Brassica napus]